MVSREPDPILKRLRRKHIRCAKQMNVIRNDDVATDTPEICCLPCGDQSSRDILVRQQPSSAVRTCCEENDGRSKTGFNRWKMCRCLSLISAGVRSRVPR